MFIQLKMVNTSVDDFVTDRDSVQKENFPQNSCFDLEEEFQHVRDCILSHEFPQTVTRDEIQRLLDAFKVNASEKESFIAHTSRTPPFASDGDKVAGTLDRDWTKEGDSFEDETFPQDVCFDLDEEFQLVLECIASHEFPQIVSRDEIQHLLDAFDSNTTGIPQTADISGDPPFASDGDKVAGTLDRDWTKEGDSFGGETFPQDLCFDLDEEFQRVRECIASHEFPQTVSRDEIQHLLDAFGADVTNNESTAKTSIDHSTCLTMSAGSVPADVAVKVIVKCTTNRSEQNIQPSNGDNGDSIGIGETTFKQAAETKDEIIVAKSTTVVLPHRTTNTIYINNAAVNKNIQFENVGIEHRMYDDGQYTKDSTCEENRLQVIGKTTSNDIVNRISQGDTNDLDVGLATDLVLPHDSTEKKVYQTLANVNTNVPLEVFGIESEPNECRQSEELIYNEHSSELMDQNQHPICHTTSKHDIFNITEQGNNTDLPVSTDYTFMNLPHAATENNMCLNTATINTYNAQYEVLGIEHKSSEHWQYTDTEDLNGDENDSQEVGQAILSQQDIVKHKAQESTTELAMASNVIPSQQAVEPTFPNRHEATVNPNLQHEILGTERRLNKNGQYIEDTICDENDSHPMSPSVSQQGILNNEEEEATITDLVVSTYVFPPHDSPETLRGNCGTVNTDIENGMFDIQHKPKYGDGQYSQDSKCDENISEDSIDDTTSKQDTGNSSDQGNTTELALSTDVILPHDSTEAPTCVDDATSNTGKAASGDFIKQYTKQEDEERNQEPNSDDDDEDVSQLMEQTIRNTEVSNRGTRDHVATSASINNTPACKAIEIATTCSNSTPVTTNVDFKGNTINFKRNHDFRQLGINKNCEVVEPLKIAETVKTTVVISSEHTGEVDMDASNSEVLPGVLKEDHSTSLQQNREPSKNIYCKLEKSSSPRMFKVASIGLAVVGVTSLVIYVFKKFLR